MNNSDHHKQRRRAPSLRLSGPRATVLPIPQKVNAPLPSHASDTYHPNNKGWPPASISSEESLTRANILETSVFLGAAKFAARVYCRPWNDTLVYYVFEGSVETIIPTFLLSNERFFLFEQFYPRQIGADLVDITYWINARGNEPGTIAFSKWINDAAPQIACAETNNAAFPSPLSTNVTEYFIRISALCKEGLVDTLGINKMDLYQNLLDPLNVKSPATRATKDQILDIINALSRSNFLDLSLYRNQVLARLFYEGHNTSWYILLMSLHLYLRFAEMIPQDYSLWLKRLRLLSPKIAHYLMLAQMWMENCTMSNDEDSDIQAATMFEDFVKPRADRIDSLKEFARAIKWPHLERIEQLPNTFNNIVDEIHFYRGNWLETWARGLTLPGPVSSFLLLGSLLDLCGKSSADQYLSLELDNSLIDLEREAANFGLSLHGSSYWHSNCVVGKVLGPHSGVWQVGDWVCGIKLPEYSSSHHFFRIVQTSTQHTIQQSDIDKLANDSDPAGNLETTYSTKDFEIPVVSFRANRDWVQFLSVKFTNCHDEQEPRLRYAHLKFLVEGEQYNRPLRYNVNFIEACKCHNGPHPLYKKYSYRTIKARKLIRLNNWNHADVEEEYDPASTNLPESAIERVPKKVLVIEASHADEEILARAWCSNIGLSAIVGDVANGSCSACIIRQAFISRISVIILTSKTIADSKSHDKTNDSGTPQSNNPNKPNPNHSNNRNASSPNNTTEEINHEVTLDTKDLATSGVQMSFGPRPSPTGSQSTGSSFIVNLTVNVANSESTSPATQKHSPKLQATVEDCKDEEETSQHCTSNKHKAPPKADTPTEYAPHICCSHHIKKPTSVPSLRAKAANIHSASVSFPQRANAANNSNNKIQPAVQPEIRELTEKLKQLQADYQDYLDRHRGHHQPNKDKDEGEDKKEKEPRRTRHSRSVTTTATTHRSSSTRRHRRRHSQRRATGTTKRADCTCSRQTERAPVPTSSSPQPELQIEFVRPSWMKAVRGLFGGKSLETVMRTVIQDGRGNMKVVRKHRGSRSKKV